MVNVFDGGECGCGGDVVMVDLISINQGSLIK